MKYSVYQEGDDYLVLAEGETTSDPTGIFRDLADAHTFASHKNGDTSKPVAWRRRRKGCDGDGGWIMCPEKPPKDIEFDLQGLALSNGKRDRG